MLNGLFLPIGGVVLGRVSEQPAKQAGFVNFPKKVHSMNYAKVLGN